MNIRIGNEVITGATVFGENVYYGDASRPAHRIELTDGITAAQIGALLTEPWELVDDDGNVQGVYQGFNTLYKHELTVIKVHPLEEQLVQAQKDAAQTVDGIMDIIQGVREK